MKLCGHPDNIASDLYSGDSSRYWGRVINDGGSVAEITIYFGDEDGGTDTDNWDQEIVLGAQPGVFENHDGRPDTRDDVLLPRSWPKSRRNDLDFIG